jgi:leader peptidase (prepilin peptidase) / N-methyltransferase
MPPLPLIFILLFLAGACLGSLVNWAIYTFAWNARPISPWTRLAPGASPRGRLTRVPIFGWLALRREAEIHGRGFWVRPLLLEIATGAALVGLYWWEVVRLGLIQEQAHVALATPTWPVHLQFASHAILFCWMLAASFIDIDEKLIPDEITVSGTILGLILAAALPLSLLPHVAERPVPMVVSAPLETVNGRPAIGPENQPMWLEPVTNVSPRPWQANGGAGNWQQLAVGLGCYWLWCFALAPRIWRGRRGSVFALQLIAVHMWRWFSFVVPRWLAILGSLAIVEVWRSSEYAWVGLYTALVGLAASGGIVWAVRLIGTAALRKEAMGFGDVTLMMMIGTFLGWQACIMLFFLAPIAALVIGIVQLIARHDDVIPYGPFLCLAALGVIVAWAPIWMWAERMFGMGGLVPAVLVICLAMLGVLLGIWQGIKMILFGSAETE